MGGESCRWIACMSSIGSAGRMRSGSRGSWGGMAWGFSWVRGDVFFTFDKFGKMKEDEWECTSPI